MVKVSPIHEYQWKERKNFLIFINEKLEQKLNYLQLSVTDSSFPIMKYSNEEKFFSIVFSIRTTQKCVKLHGRFVYVPIRRWMELNRVRLKKRG